MKRLRKCLFDFGLFFLVALSGMSFATPSTQIWNPSADIQATGVWHLGIDDYFTIEDRTNGGWSAPTDIGITYGLVPGVELGVDVFMPQALPGSQLAFNAKFGISESEIMPALALGGFGFGLAKGVNDMNVIYGVAAKTTPLGRLSFGYFTGNEVTIGVDNKGFILTWDKTLTDKLWVCIDHASGTSTLGATFYGFSWLFAPNISVIFAYGTYNAAGVKPTITTQLDINL